MCGKSRIIVKIINVITKLNDLPNRLTGRMFLRNTMPVTLGQINNIAHLPKGVSEMPIFFFFFEFL